MRRTSLETLGSKKGKQRKQAWYNGSERRMGVADGTIRNNKLVELPTQRHQAGPPDDLNKHIRWPYGFTSSGRTFLAKALTAKVAKSERCLIAGSPWVKFWVQLGLGAPRGRAFSGLCRVRDETAVPFHRVRERMGGEGLGVWTFLFGIRARTSLGLFMGCPGLGC